MIKLNIDNNEVSLVDALVDSEYFASLCGFNFPIGELDDSKKNGSLRLIAETNTSYDNKNVKYGLMVWHNKNHYPHIEFKEQNDELIITIENERKLPYPAIQRTNAWLDGLEFYLNEKPEIGTSERIEREAKNKFLENIFAN